MPTPSTGYAIASLAALKAIAPTDRANGYTRLVLSDAENKPAWYTFLATSTLAGNDDTVLLPSDNPSAGRWLKSSGTGGGSEKLESDRTYYIATTGNDSNEGSPASPFRSIQKFINVASSFDLNGFNITGAIFTGTYVEALTLRPFLGQGYIRVSGLPDSIVEISPISGECVYGNFDTGKYQLDNVKLTPPFNAHIYLERAAYLEYWAITFSGTDPEVDHVTLSGQKVRARQIDIVTIESSGYSHMYITDGATFEGGICTIVGNPAFSDAFIWATSDSCARWYGTFTGTATGKRFSVRSNATVIVDSTDLNYFPGSLAGTVDSGGLYIKGDRTVISDVIASTEKGAANGVATLDADRLVLRTQLPPTTRNEIINGDFLISQRGTSFNLATFSYTLDRWINNVNPDGGTAGSGTITRQTLGLGELSGEPEFFCRIQNTSTGASLGVNSIHTLQQRIESVRKFANSSCTVSFWARSSYSKRIAIEIAQNFGGGGTPSSNVFVAPQQLNLTTTWQFYTATFSLPSLTGKTIGTNQNDFLQLNIFLQAGSGMDARTGQTGGLPWGSTGTIDFADIQLESGRTATKFDRRFVGEALRFCQRYYETGNVKFTGYQIANNSIGISNTFLVSKRAIPTITPTIVLFTGLTGSPLVGGASNTKLLIINAIKDANSGFFDLNVSYIADAEL